MTFSVDLSFWGILEWHFQAVCHSGEGWRRLQSGAGRLLGKTFIPEIRVSEFFAFQQITEEGWQRMTNYSHTGSLFQMGGPFQMGGAISNGRDHFKWEGHFKQVLTRSHIWLVRLASTQVGGKNKLKGPQFDSSWWQTRVSWATQNETKCPPKSTQVGLAPTQVGGQLEFPGQPKNEAKWTPNRLKLVANSSFSGRPDPTSGCSRLGGLAGAGSNSSWWPTRVFRSWGGWLPLKLVANSSLVSKMT